MIRRLLGLAFAVLLVPGVADACPICFGAADSPLLDAARLGVLVMIAVTIAILGAFARFFLRLRRLAATQAQADAFIQPEVSR